MPEHKCISGDRLTRFEDALEKVRTCITKIKTDAAADRERGKSAHNRIDDASHAHEELETKLARLAETMEERDREQDRRINKLSIQIAILVAIVEMAFKVGSNLLP